jgi:hypothetical protein
MLMELPLRRKQTSSIATAVICISYSIHVEIIPIPQFMFMPLFFEAHQPRPVRYSP